MSLHEFLALVGGFIRFKPQETVVTSGFRLRTSTASKYKSIEALMVGNMGTHGFSPLGFNGFCLGSVASIGFASGAGAGAGPPHHEDIYKVCQQINVEA